MNALDDALSRLSDADLVALSAAVDAMRPGPAPNFLEWLGITVDRERRRETGIDVPELPLAEALPPGEFAVALATATALRDTATSDRVRALFAAITAVLLQGSRH